MSLIPVRGLTDAIVIALFDKADPYLRCTLNAIKTKVASAGIIASEEEILETLTNLIHSECVELLKNSAGTHVYQLLPITHAVMVELEDAYLKSEFTISEHELEAGMRDLARMSSKHLLPKN